MKQAQLFIILLSVCFFAFMKTVSADLMPSRGVGKTITPFSDAPVRMVRERVDITIDNNVAQVMCRFVFVNEGPADTLEVGFPRGWGEKELQDFEVIFDGQRLPITEKKLDPEYRDESGMKIPFWTTFSLPLEAGEKEIFVFVGYSAILLSEAKMRWSDLLFKYVLKTGAYWKGNIGEAVIRLSVLNTHPDQITSISPKGFIREGNLITWHLTDFEPREDIEILIAQDVVYDRMKEAKRLLEEDTENAHAHFLLGTIDACQSRRSIKSEKARREFEQAVALDPEHWDARWFLAMGYGRQPEKQREHLEAIVRGKPDYRCTDEAFLRFYNYLHIKQSAQEWLDILDYKDASFVGRLIQAPPDSLKTSCTIIYDVIAMFKERSGHTRPVKAGFPVSFSLKGHAEFSNGKTTILVETNSESKAIATIEAIDDGDEILTITLPEKSDENGRRSGKILETLKFRVEAP